MGGDIDTYCSVFAGEAMLFLFRFSHITAQMMIFLIQTIPVFKGIPIWNVQSGRIKKLP